MKNIMRKTFGLLIMLCVAMLIGCTAGPSVKESGPVSEIDLSEETDTSGSEAGPIEEVEGVVKEEGRLMDDTYYVVDIYSILMLCEEDKDLGYKENIQALKGDSTSVAEAVERLKDMEQTPAIMNAIGVGYMRLDKSEEAKKILEGALEMADDDRDRVCILNNLGSVRLLGAEDIINGTITLDLDQALKIETDPVRRIILDTNRLGYGPFLYLDDDWKEKLDKDVERSLKEEREILGSNQIAGIQNYLTLADCSQGDEDIGYYNKALELNHEQYQYRAFDIVAYSGLKEYYRRNGDLEKALEYLEKRIKVGEGFSADTDSDRIIAYMDKSVLLVKREDYDEAIQCVAPLLELEGYALNLKAMMYLKVGEAYYGKEDLSKAEEMVEKAYNLFDRYKKEEGDSGWDIDEMLKQHDEADYNESDPDYMQWVRNQLKG